MTALRAIDGGFVDALKARSVTDETIRSLVDANGIHRIKRMLDSPAAKVYTYAANSAPTFMMTGRAGESFLHELVGIPNYKQVKTLVVLPDGTEYARFADGIVMQPNGERVFHEVKVGYAASAFTKFQVTKDSAILANVADSYEWHFLPSAVTGKIGPSDFVLSTLEDAGIQIVMHVQR